MESQAQTQAQAEDPKKLAEAMLLADEPLDNIVAKTGLSKQAILGLKGQLVKSGKLAKEKATQAEEGEGVGVPPLSVSWLEQVKAELQRELPKIYGLSKTAVSAILDSLDEATASDPQALFSHIILMSGNPRINYYHVWKTILSLFGPMNPPFMPIQTPQTFFTPLNPYSFTSHQRDSLSSYLMSRLERLEDELREEREKRIQAQFDRLNDKIELLSYPRPSKSTVEIIDKLVDKADSRFARLEEALARGPPPGSWNPQIIRSPAERQQKAQEIMTKLKKTEEILQAEDELLKACKELDEEDKERQILEAEKQLIESAKKVKRTYGNPINTR